MTDAITGCANRGLHIDLSVRKATSFEISREDRRLYLGVRDWTSPPAPLLKERGAS